MKGLCDADRDIRSALCHLIGRSLSDDDWRLASLGITAGGLGARSAAEHAPAAYVPAFLLVVTFFGRISTPSTLMTGVAFLLLSPPFAASFRLGPTLMLRVILRRRSLFLAKLRPSRCPAFLLTLPSFVTVVFTSMRAAFLELGLGSRPTLRLLAPMSLPLLFRTALHRRLRMPLWDHDTACSMCGEVLDR